jgi:hypothetical protein
VGVSTTDTTWDALQLQLSAQRIFGGDDALRDAEEIDVICRRLGLDFMQTLRPGTRVAIDDGLFQGVHGTVLGFCNDQQVVVSIELMNDLVAVELDPTSTRIDNAFAPVHGLPTA